MKDCKGCNHTNSDGSIYCDRCGARLEEKMPEAIRAKYIAEERMKAVAHERSQSGDTKVIESSPLYAGAGASAPRRQTLADVGGRKYPALHLYLRITEVLAWVGVAATAVYLYFGWSGLSQIQAQAQAYVFLVLAVIGLLFLCLASLASAQLIRVFMDMESHLDEIRRS